MKRLTFLFLFILFSHYSNAVEFGLGASLRSGELGWYLPINISDSLRIEPFVLRRKNKDEYTSSTYKYKYHEFGSGIFYTREVQTNLTNYLGTRLAYIEETSEQTSDFFYDKTSRYGHKFSLVFGGEYHFIDSFSIGAEAEWSYSETSSTFDNGSSRSKEKRKEEQNTSRVLVRYYF